MSKKDHSIIMRHVLEVRLKNRQFSFLDYKGELADYFIKKTGFGKVRLTGDRIDVVSDDLNKIYFVSLENFGFQLDGSRSFKEFSENTQKFFEIIEEFKKYDLNNIIRIGTRTSVLYHAKGDSLEGLKQKFKNRMAENSTDLEKAIGQKINDVAYTYDLENNEHKSHLLLGPVMLQEANNRFLGGKKVYESFEKDQGIYYEIDLYKEISKNIDISEAKRIIEENVSSISSGFENFINYFYKNNG
jgi:hypothetical protein